jgi:hypothetical protein
MLRSLPFDHFKPKICPINPTINGNGIHIHVPRS